MESAATETSAFFKYPANNTSAMKYQTSKLQTQINFKCELMCRIK